jgi:hypothetical protein
VLKKMRLPTAVRWLIRGYGAACLIDFSRRVPPAVPSVTQSWIGEPGSSLSTSVKKTFEPVPVRFVRFECRCHVVTAIRCVPVGVPSVIHGWDPDLSPELKPWNTTRWPSAVYCDVKEEFATAAVSRWGSTSFGCAACAGPATPIVARATAINAAASERAGRASNLIATFPGRPTWTAPCGASRTLGRARIGRT